MTNLPTDQYGLIRRAATIRRGISDDVVAAAVRSGEYIRLAPGVCVEADEKFTIDVEGRDLLYRLRSIAVATSTRDRGAAVLSHYSAAALLGLEVLHPDQGSVHFTKAGPSGGFSRGLRTVHAGPIADDQVVMVDGLLATRLERTAVDVAMAGNFDQALVVFDRALAKGANRAEMSQLLEARTGWRGVDAARRGLGHADRRSESVGEAWSRAQMITAGLPGARLQHTFQTADGQARTDFDWDGRLVGEFDGLHKYGRLLRPGESPRDALIREKAREDALRAIDVMVLRWTWAMLERGEVVGLIRPWLDRFGLLAA